MAISVDLTMALDKAWEDKSLSEILAAPPSALAGLTPAHDKALADALGIKTIADLGSNSTSRWPACWWRWATRPAEPVRPGCATATFGTDRPGHLYLCLTRGRCRDPSATVLLQSFPPGARDRGRRPRSRAQFLEVERRRQHAGDDDGQPWWALTASVSCGATVNRSPTTP